VKVGNLFFSTCSNVSKSICVELGKVEGGSYNLVVYNINKFKRCNHFQQPKPASVRTIFFWNG
ncbi:MAG: hypothetical protein PV347_04165, partial [Rickettsiaceae bacterium]|nr:hypothetical protein [Rickettsiaceae bacterium]